MELNIPVVLGSVRNGRKSVFAAKFFMEKLQEKNIQTQLVDFKELPLPFMDAEAMPSDMYPTYPYENVNSWSKIADAADGFIIIAPEYNHGYTGVLKNALDWLYKEFYRKPAGLVGVSSGKISGARGLEQLRPIMENFGMFAMRETVMFGPVSNAFDESGKLIDESYLKQTEGLLNSLIFSAQAMKTAKENK